MSDIIDQGNDTADWFLEVARRNQAPAKEIRGIGLCLNCGAAVEDDRRWCDIECRADWERANARR